MFKATIAIDERSDPDETMENFRARLKASDADLPLDLYDLVATEVRDLSERGSQLAEVGSAFAITRTLSDENYEVVLKVTFGEKRGLFDRVRSFFR